MKKLSKKIAIVSAISLYSILLILSGEKFFTIIGVLTITALNLLLLGLLYQTEQDLKQCTDSKPLKESKGVFVSIDVMVPGKVYRDSTSEIYEKFIYKGSYNGYVQMKLIDKKNKYNYDVNPDGCVYFLLDDGWYFFDEDNL